MIADAARLAPAERLGHLHLAGTIAAVSRAGRSPKMPADLSAAFENGVRRLGELALEALSATLTASEENLGVLLGTVAVARGQAPLANVLRQWPSDLECGDCGSTMVPASYALKLRSSPSGRRRG